MEYDLRLESVLFENHFYCMDYMKSYKEEDVGNKLGAIRKEMAETNFKKLSQNARLLRRGRPQKIFITRRDGLQHSRFYCVVISCMNNVNIMFLVAWFLRNLKFILRSCDNIFLNRPF